MRISWTAGLVLACGLALAPAARAETPDPLLQILQAAQALDGLDTRPADASGGDLWTGLRRQRALASYAEVVTLAMDRYPNQREEILVLAVMAAPALGEAVLGRIEAAYPNLPFEAVSTTPLAADRPRIQRDARARQLAANESSDAFSQLEADEDLMGDENAAPELDDPIEGLNRFIFAFNDMIDTLALRPLAGLYSFVAPETVKRSMRNFFDNLDEPVVFANELLQFEGEAAAVTLGRFVVNSTVGAAGLFDVAEEWGMPAQTADFGQTLYVYGVGPGPYIMLPLIGPSSARHTVGRGMDTLMHPRTWLLPTGVNLGLTGGNALVLRERLIEPLDQLRLGSLDYYSALRSAYYQNRLRTIREEQSPDDFEVQADSGQ